MLRFALPSASAFAPFLSISLCFALLTSSAPPPSVAATAARKAVPTAGAAARVARQAESRPGDLLVRFREGVPERERDDLVGARGGRRRGALRGASGVERVSVAASRPLEQLAAELAQLPAVEYAEPNFVIRGEQISPADPRFAEQWALRNTGQTGGTAGSDVGAEAAWQKTTGSRQTVVAVVDSGVDFTHPDLASNAWSNPRERADGRDDDRNGYADDLAGWDWVAQSGDVADPHGHGTAVAGIIAAGGHNGVGIAGVMWRASLMSLRVLDQTGTGDVAAAVEAIDYAVEHGASVINLSWGTGGETRALRDAIRRAGLRGVLVVCSAGNSAHNNDAEPYYPASYDLPNVVSVAAADGADRMATWSNWGALGVDVAAPGSDILTTLPGGDYRAVSGTSAAAPVVSGVAGLVKSLYPRLGAEAMRSAILSGARRVAALEGVVAAGGVVSASGALDAAASGQTGGDLGGSGNGQGNGQGSGQGGAGNGNGGWNDQSPRPGAPAHGNGGRGPNGSFDAAPAPHSQATPPNFQNQDEVRRRGQIDHTAPAFISANSLPLCDADCGDSYPSGGASGTDPSDPYFATARIETENETGQPGVDLGSRNFNWGTSLVNLTGRAGLDLSIGLYYNSLVWTKQGNSIQYNADHGFPGPGFRLGFPVLQPRHTNSQTGLNSYVMITSSGGRVEMGQIGATNIYESADGSFTHLTDNGPGSVVVRTADGTQLTFVLNTSINEYRCTEIKDRNGNRITINYDPAVPAGALGRPTSVIDTAGREIVFIYDGQNYLTTIRQEWTREVPGGIVSETHVWAKFYYGTVTLQPNFPGLSVVAETSHPIPVLVRVDMSDNSFFQFDYEPAWGVVKRISHYGPDPGSRLISYTSYNIPAGGTALDDSPRFTERRDWAQDWNNGQEAVTAYALTENVTWQMPDGTPQRTGTRTTVTSPAFVNKDGAAKQIVSKVYMPSDGWDAGLTALEETYEKDVASGVETRQRQMSYSWAQDVTAPAALPVSDAGFEALSIGYGNYMYNTNWGWWSFAGLSGISGNASGFTASNPPAPEGGHVAFLQGGSGSVISQAVGTFYRGVPYTLSFRAAQRANWNQGGQDFDVYLDDLHLGTFRPAGTFYGSYSVTFTAPPGAHTLKFVGRNSSGGDNTALIDDVRITASAVSSNPRLAELNVYDSGNRKRTTFQYGDYNLPTAVREYAANAQDVLRQTNTSYELNGAFVSRRIIGLVGAREVFENGATLVSRVTYTYDSTTLSNPGAVQQHDGANYGAGFQLGRANLTEVRRFNVNAPQDQELSAASTMGYDTAGNVVWEKDASDHTVNIDYADSFSLGGAYPGTRAYPTTVTDPDGHSSTAKYNYYLGAFSRTVDPKGAARTFTYDFAGRPLRETNEVNGAYTRFEYDPNWGHTRAYATVTAGLGEAYTNTIRDGGGRVRLVVVSHPNSTGQYFAIWTKHDALGRPSEQSNATEITGGGTPVGDDAAAGYQFTKQAYDWKGRPTLTTFPAVAGQAVGNTKESTYEGCGCAGGEVVTIRDERGRRRKLYSDVLGRLTKAEELNWDASVYSTTNYSYNARDQITQINQAGQPRTFQYDGHGRLWKRTTPEQGQTEYAYYGDDTVWWAKDARGAKTVFDYNGRHQPVWISYDLSGVLPGQNVAPTANVTMQYDQAGNRTLLDDGIGQVAYSYNTLSQLQSETRTFDGLVGSPYMPSGSVTLSYGYNLAGQVTSMYNSWNGVTVGYEHDANGRLDKVTGAGYAGVGTYASNLRYRAFGGLKRMDYNYTNNNTRTLSAQYDARLRLTRWDVGGVSGYEYFYDNAANPSWVLSDKAHRVTYARNLYDPSLDRSFDYDHAGRLQYSHSGVEARMHVTGQPNDGGGYGPYAHHYNYDQFGNLTARYGWGGANPSYTATYANNRRAGLTYDSAGNVVGDGGQSFAYDATGQQTYASGGNLNQAYDGDGLRARKTESGYNTYYLRATALGGKVVCEVNHWGGWLRGYVYAGSQLLAIQYGGVNFVHQDPVVKSQRVTDSVGNIHTTVELDPWGGETSRSSNSAFQPQRFTSYLRDGNESDEAMFRRYNRWWSRFDQPDPYDGSYDLTDPQSFNRYSYTQNDPVNYTDPLGLYWAIDWLSCRSEVADVSEPGGEPILRFTGREICNLVWVGPMRPFGGERDFGGGGLVEPNSNGQKEGPPCDTSESAVRRAAQAVTSKVPGASVGSLNGQPVINFSGNFEQTSRQLRGAGYYTGIRAFNPFDHPNGLEFRTHGSPGFHFKVVYPDVKETHVGGRLGVKKDDSKPALATDLHIDCNNPVGAGVRGFVKHGADFMRHHGLFPRPYIPLPPLVPNILRR